MNYTLQELTERFAMSKTGITYKAQALLLPPHYRQEGKVKTRYFTEEEAVKLASLMKYDSTKNPYEDERKKHPFVTDPRCFDLNWWPDTVPDCFKELEEDGEE